MNETYCAEANCTSSSQIVGHENADTRTRGSESRVNSKVQKAIRSFFNSTFKHAGKIRIWLNTLGNQSVDEIKLNSSHDYYLGTRIRGMDR